MDWQNLIISLGLTFIFTWLIGYERQKIGKDAGISAHVLMAMAACAIAIMQREMYLESKKLVLDNPELVGKVVVENQRIIAQVITGIGFIGAGIILKSGGHVRGLTTAATLWTSAIIGLIMGTGYYILGSILGGFSVIFMYVRDFYRGFNPFLKQKHDIND